MVKCTRIGVNCVANDSVDIRIGGPTYLGFDFNVLPEETYPMIDFIKRTLLKYEVPSQTIYIDGEIEVSEEHVWTQERIEAEIAKDAEELQEAHQTRVEYSRK